MGAYEDKEAKEIEELYPKDSLEYQVLEYSRACHHQEEVPPMLVAAFKILMGLSGIMAIVGVAGYLSH